MAFVYCFAISIPVGLVSLTLSKAAVFSRFRTFVESKSVYWGEAINCTYCTSFIVGLISMPFTLAHVDITSLPYVAVPVNLATGWLTVVAFSSITAGFVYRMYAVMAPVAVEGQTELTEQINEQIELLQQIESWLINNPSGNVSAKAMIEIVTGMVLTTNPLDAWPKSPQDIEACRQLLKDVPALKLYLELIKAASPGWATLIYAQ